MSGKQHTTCLVSIIAIAACMALCLLSVTLSAQVVFAGSGSSGSYDFNAAGTWIGGVPPAANDNVEIEVNTGIDVTIYDFPSSSFNSLHLKGDGILHIHTDDDALITLGSGILGDANAFIVESDLDVYIDGLYGSVWLLVVATSGFNEAQIEGKIYLRPGTDGEIIQLISQEDPSLDKPIWNFKSGSLIEIGNDGNNFYKDDYPFSNSGLTPDLGLETHVFQNGSKLVQRDGLDPFGDYTIGVVKCRFESGSTFEFADNNWVIPSTIHKPKFENRTYGNFIFSSTKDLSFDETMLADAVCNIENLTIVSNKLSFQQRRQLTLNISGNITLPNGTVSNTYLEFNPPAIVTGPPLLPGGRIIVNITNPGTPAASFSGGSNILFANRDADINFQAFSVTNCAVHIQIDASPATDGRLTVETDARLNMIGEHYIHGTGQFNMQAGTVLGIGSAAGITASANAGNVRTANRIYSVNGENTFVYQGNLSPQSTGNGLTSWTSGSAGQTIIIDKDNSTDEVELTNTVHRVYKLEVNKGRFKLKSNDIFTVSDKPGSPGDLIVTTDGRFETATNTTVVFQGSVLVTAATAIDFVNVDIITGSLVGVNFGGGAVRPTVHNQLRMISTATVSANPPFYAPNSTLIYRTANYTAGAEWATGVFSASSPGVPHHVQIGQAGGSPAQDNTNVAITSDRQCLGNLIIGDPTGGTGYRIRSLNGTDILRIGGNLVRNASSTTANSFFLNSLVVFNGTSEQLITDLSTTARGMALPRVEINNPAGVKLNSSALTVVIMSGSTGNVFRMFNGNLDLNGGYVTMITNNGTLIAEGGVRRITNTHATQQGQFTINADGKVFSAASGGSWVFDRGPSKGVTLISRNGAFNFGLVSGSPIVTINDSLVILHNSGFTNSPFYGSQSTLVYGNPGGRNTGTIGTLTEWQPVPGTPAGAGQPVNVQLGLGFGYPHLSGFNLALEGATTSGTPTLTLTNNTIRRVSGNITLGHAAGGGTHTLALGTGSPSTTVLQVGGNWLRYSNSSLSHLNRPVTFDGSTDQTITAFGGGTQAFGIVDINKTGGGELQLVAGTTIDLQATTASATPSLPALLNMRAGNLNLNGGSCTLSGSLAVGVQVTGTRFITSTAAGGQFNFNAGVARTILPSSSPGNTLAFNTNVLVNLNTGVNFGSSTTTIQGQLRMNAGGIVNTNPPFYDNNSYLIYNTTGTASPATEWLAGSESTSDFGVPHHVQVGLTAGGNNSKAEITTDYRFLKGDMIIGDGSSGTGYELIMSGSGVLRVGGNWTRYNNGTFTRGTRQVIFRSASNATINAAGGETFYDVAIHKVSADNTVTLNNVVSVANNLTLTVGRVISDLTNFLHVTNPSLTAITGGHATSYVQGPLRRRVNNIAGVANQMRFPVGEFNGGTHYYKPVWLQDVVASNGTSTAYQAAYYRGNPPPNPTSYFFSGFAQGVLAGEYWRFESLNATPTDGILVLDYNSSANFMDIFKSPFNPSDPSTHEVGIYRKFNTNPLNVTYQPTNTSGVLSYFTTPQQVTTYTNYMQLATAPGMNFNNHQFFTLAWVKENILILPIQLLSFEASLQPGNSSLLTWQIADDKDLQQFEVEVSRDGQRFTKLTGIGRNGTQYTYRHTGLQSGVYYYRLHILGKDGSRAYSKVQMVQVGVNVTVIQGLLQNPVQGGRALVKVYSATPQDAFATVVDHAGRVLLRQKIALTKGNNLAPLSVLPLMPGMYRLQLQTADGVQQTMPFVK